MDMHKLMILLGKTVVSRKFIYRVSYLYHEFFGKFPMIKFRGGVSDQIGFILGQLVNFGHILEKFDEKEYMYTYLYVNESDNWLLRDITDQEIAFMESVRTISIRKMNYITEALYQILQGVRPGMTVYADDDTRAIDDDIFTLKWLNKLSGNRIKQITEF